MAVKEGERNVVVHFSEDSLVYVGKKERSGVCTGIQNLTVVATFEPGG